MFPDVFFPKGNPKVAIVESLATHGVGYVARPIGAFFLGRVPRNPVYEAFRRSWPNMARVCGEEWAKPVSEEEYTKARLAAVA